MYTGLKRQLEKELHEVQEAGLYKRERIITTAQGAIIRTNGKEVINFCANNYLGLSSHPRVIDGKPEAAMVLRKGRQLGLLPLPSRNP